jgi:SAM-dependent methyltransferase
VPEIVDGSGESLPFTDGHFDIVLCYSEHQYMDVRTALTEMARVLRRGGELQIFGGTLGSFVAVSLGELARRSTLGGLKQFGLTLVNTLAYSVTGRRAIVPDGWWSTAAPIYPSCRPTQVRGRASRPASLRNA